MAGAPAATGQVQKQLQRQEGAFEVHRYADETAARQAIRDREVYGAFVVAPGGPKLLTASAAGPVVSQLLEGMAGHLAPDGARVRTDDVVAAPPGDPRGAALGASLLPLALAGVAGGVLVTVLRLRAMGAVPALLASAALVGAVGAGIADSWLGLLDGNWWAEAAAIGLTSLAVSSAVAGLAALLGYAGIVVGALIAVVLGNPFSGVTSAPEMLPGPVGMPGQWLPPGAGGTLMRSVAFFDGHAVETPVLVLTAWAVLGLTAVTVAGIRSAARGTPSAVAA